MALGWRSLVQNPLQARPVVVYWDSSPRPHLLVARMMGSDNIRSESCGLRKCCWLLGGWQEWMEKARINQRLSLQLPKRQCSLRPKLCHIWCHSRRQCAVQYMPIGVSLLRSCVFNYRLHAGNWPHHMFQSRNSSCPFPLSFRCGSHWRFPTGPAAQCVGDDGSLKTFGSNKGFHLLL